MTVVVGLVLALEQPLLGETEINYSGEVRYRSEFDDRSFSSGRARQYFDLLRTRAGIEVLVDSNVHAVVQLQDSRIIGGQNEYGDYESGTLNAGSGVNAHQAYLQIDRLWADGIGFKAGRFEFVLGNERVFGAVGWSNVGRSWEGLQTWYKSDEFQLTGFLLKLQEENDPYFNRDFDLFGAHFRFARAGLELLAFYERDADTIGVADTDYNALDRYNLGLYWQRRFDNWKVELNGAFQSGKITDSLDIQAFMAQGEVGYAFDGQGAVYVALGGDYTSGDDNPNDADYKMYDNLYYTGHKFRGYMDYFTASESSGLIDLMVRGRGQVLPKWQVMLDGHYFRTAQDYLDPADSSATSEVGLEFDLTVVTTSVKGITLQGGASIFLPEEPFVRMRLGSPSATESDPTVWAYGQATVSF